jgi:hypothetical protein
MAVFKLTSSGGPSFAYMPDRTQSEVLVGMCQLKVSSHESRLDCHGQMPYSL